MNVDFDLVCVGFGPAALSLAVTMADTGRITANFSSVPCVSTNESLRVLFIEKQQSFLWHGGMLVEDSRMRISFVKDLASLRDPTSRFTFLNYLKVKERLVTFLNLGTFYPYRVEFNDYLTWAAEKFSHLCAFGETVTGIEPGTTSENTNDDIKYFRILSTGINGTRKIRTARNVVIAVGGQPSYPKWCSSLDNQVIHTAEYSYRIDNLFIDKDVPKNIAVIGSGQSAAEVYSDVIKRFPKCKTSLIFRDTALRPSDDSPFVNEVFDPSSTSEFLKKDFFDRQMELKKNRSTNYAVVNIDMIESLYGMLYKQKLPGSTMTENEILSSHQIESAHKEKNGQITLKLIDTSIERKEYYKTFDAVFVGTGYTRVGHLDILKSVRQYCTPRGNCCKIEGVDAVLPLDDYRVLMDDRCKAGIWLQGCCEDTHGLSDTLLSVISVRSEEVLKSIEKNLKLQKDLVLHSTVATPTTIIFPAKSEPGTVLYTEFNQSLGETLTFRVADPDIDLENFHIWMNNSRVSKFWGEQGPKSHQAKYLDSQMKSFTSIPIIGVFNSTPFAYFEVYWAAVSNLTPFYKLDSYDRGIHMLVGDESFRGPHRVSAWLPALVRFCFRDDERTKRVVSEPRADNKKMISYMNQHGFSNIGQIQLPHKIAELMIIERLENVFYSVGK
ncbi:hypothetical protein HK096_002700 [Nowakowskiella sp. JEL0078]|nr:hypothetical protein HK096_002700 [Nowakowskiella sp. JEL0078]